MPMATSNEDLDTIIDRIGVPQAFIAPLLLRFLLCLMVGACYEVRRAGDRFASPPLCNALCFGQPRVRLFEPKKEEWSEYSIF